MAVCPICDQEMTVAASCVGETIDMFGVSSARVRHDRSRGGPDERCPHCGGQLIFCDCDNDSD